VGVTCLVELPDIIDDAVDKMATSVNAIRDSRSRYSNTIFKQFNYNAKKLLRIERVIVSTQNENNALTFKSLSLQVSVSNDQPTSCNIDVKILSLYYMHSIFRLPSVFRSFLSLSLSLSLSTLTIFDTRIP